MAKKRIEEVLESKTVVMEQEQMGLFDLMKELAIGDT